MTNTLPAARVPLVPWRPCDCMQGLPRDVFLQDTDSKRPWLPSPFTRRAKTGLGVEQAFEDGKRLNQGMDTGWVQGIFCVCVFDYQAGRRLIKMRKDLFVTYKHLVNEMADGQE